jgi:hypothetical protein
MIDNWIDSSEKAAAVVLVGIVIGIGVFWWFDLRIDPIAMLAAMAMSR